MFNIIINKSQKRARLINFETSQIINKFDFDYLH